MKKRKYGLKLHLGCGKRYLPGFMHIDKDRYKHVDHISDIKKLNMIPSNGADLIYCCHAFNYLDYDEAMEALREWYRVLRKGGILRLSIPDFEAIILTYKKFKDIILLKNLILGRYKSKKGEIYHKAIYDYKLLKDMIRKAGFRNIHRYNWRKVFPKDYDDYSQAYLPHMEREKGILMSINLEAKK